MKKPAFSDIHGTYPEKKDEIMLPIRALNGMGITEPELGMEISDRILFTDGSEMEGTLRLSGYYTEYMDPTFTVPSGYFSKEFYDSLDLDTDAASTLLIRQDDRITDEDIMKRLYEDVTMRDDSQQFLGENSYTWQAVYSMTGGFGMAAFLAVVILAGAGMLLYNVMHISVSRDIRQYGLLKTMGATKAQLERIVFRQTLRTVLWGCLTGAGAGRRKRIKRRQDEEITDDGGGIALMAWRNLFRFRKRFFITAVSLLLGVTVSLGAAILARGTDETNRIDHERADFSVEVMMNAMSVDSYPADRIFFPQEIQDQIMNLRGVVKSETSWGGYGRISMKEEAIRVFAGDSRDEKETSPFVVQVMSDEWLEQLAEFSEKEGLGLDVESVRKGKGLIFLHYRVLSQIEEEKGKEDIGKDLTLTDLDGNGAQTMKFAGYLDYLKRGIPEFKNTGVGPGIIYFLTGERGFQKLGLTEQTFRINLEADPEFEPTLKATLAGITADYNRSNGFVSENSNEIKLESLTLSSKSDELKARKDYIASSRIVMSSLCVLLILMGLVNYVNVTLTGLAMRRKESAVLESIGLTRRQFKRMLLLEGVFYSMIVTVLLLTIGTGALYVFGAVMDKKIVYFVFRYPMAEMVLCIFLLFVICTAVPLILLSRTERASVVERLKACSI